MPYGYTIQNGVLLGKRSGLRQTKINIFNRRTNQVSTSYKNAIKSNINQFRNTSTGRLADRDGVLADLVKRGLLHNNADSRRAVEDVLNQNMGAKNNLTVRSARGKTLFVYNARTNHKLDTKYKKQLTNQITSFPNTKKAQVRLELK